MRSACRDCGRAVAIRAVDAIFGKLVCSIYAHGRRIFLCQKAGGRNGRGFLLHAVFLSRRCANPRQDIAGAACRLNRRACRAVHPGIGGGDVWGDALAQLGVRDRPAVRACEIRAGAVHSCDADQRQGNRQGRVRFVRVRRDIRMRAHHARAQHVDSRFGCAGRGVHDVCMRSQAQVVCRAVGAGGRRGSLARRGRAVQAKAAFGVSRSVGVAARRGLPADTVLLRARFGRNLRSWIVQQPAKISLSAFCGERLCVCGGGGRVGIFGVRGGACGILCADIFRLSHSGGVGGRLFGVRRRWNNVGHRLSDAAQRRCRHRKHTAHRASDALSRLWRKFARDVLFRRRRVGRLFSVERKGARFLPLRHTL